MFTNRLFVLSLACLSLSSGVIAADYGQSIQIPMKDKGLLWDSDIVLEATLYKPKGEGPFPVVIFNHGSTGGDKEYAKQTVNPWGFGKYLNDKKSKPSRRNMYDLTCSVFFNYGCFDKNNR